MPGLVALAGAARMLAPAAVSSAQATSPENREHGRHDQGAGAALSSGAVSL
jgi:hypothetical protein